MSNELQVRSDFESALGDIEKIQSLCVVLMKMPHYQKMGEAVIFGMIQMAKLLNIPALEALNGGLYCVQGKYEMQGRLMMSLIRRAGHSVSIDSKSTQSMVIMHGKRCDNGDCWTVQFSTDDAKRAGIYKGSWEKYPQDMCAWRCVSKLGRFLFPDVIKGCYVVGEISEDFSNKKMEESEDVKVVETFLNKINEQQLQQITSILNECSPDYVSVIARRLEKLDIKYYKDMTIEVYEKLLPHAISSRDMYQKELSEKQMMTNEDAVVEGISEVEQ